MFQRVLVALRVLGSDDGINDASETTVDAEPDNVTKTCGGNVLVGLRTGKPANCSGRRLESRIKYLKPCIERTMEIKSKPFVISTKLPLPILLSSLNSR